MLYGFREEKRAKGQNMVEYALMLAIVVGIGWGIYDQAGLASSIKGIFGDAGNLISTASKGEKSAFDIQPSIETLKSLIPKYSKVGQMEAGDQNTNRGILMDGWLDAEDQNRSDIAKLSSELGAKQWTYYHGEGPKYPNSISSDSVGLYWSTEDLSKAQLTGDNYSNESVLSYYYDGSRYYVMKNRVWMDQKKYNDGQPGLASKEREYGKPAADIVGGYSTYAEAQQAYEKAKRGNDNSVVFTNK
jgi:Flp pilus assembly pilin Flp